MSGLKYKTRGNSSAQGKPRVYFCCHPEDFNVFFDEIATEILAKQNCAIYYYDPYTQNEHDDIFLDLSQMQLFVIPVTLKFLCEDNHAFNVEFKYAVEHHIPILPLMQDRHLEKIFNERCGEIQFLDKNTYDPTSIGYDEKLEKFLKAVLISDEMADKIRGAFDAYVFLSYRKKDRKYAQELMKLMHKNDFCRSVAIWYDEFLVPGENFNDAILNAIKKCQLFTLLVTPNLINEENYVVTTEYPIAREQEKTIFPVEAVDTDKEKMKKVFSDMPDCVSCSDEKLFSDMLKKVINKIVFKSNGSSFEHRFFLGLAYLNGVDVEVDYDMALKLITEAAKGGVEDAIKKLVFMYKNAEGVEKNYRIAKIWQRELIDFYKKLYFNKKIPTNLRKLIDSINELIFLNTELYDYKEAMLIIKEISNSDIIKEVADIDMVYSYKLYASVYFVLGMYKKTEEFLEKAIYVIRTNINYFSEFLLYECYEQLGDLYAYVGRVEDAENIYYKSLNFFKASKDENKQYYLIGIYEKIALFYYHRKPFLQKKAYELMDAVLRTLKGLHEEQPEKYEKDLACSYINNGNICVALNKFDEAEISFIEAFKILKVLYKKNEKLCASTMARLYMSLGRMYNDWRKYPQAEKMFLRSIEIYEDFCIGNYYSFEDELADKYIEMAKFYGKLKRVEDENVMNNKILQLCLRCSEFEEKELSVKCIKKIFKLALLCEKYKRTDEAEKYGLLAIEKINNLQEITGEKYEKEFIEGYKLLAQIYRDSFQFEEAERMYTKGIGILEHMDEIDILKIDEKIESWYYNIAQMLYTKASLCIDNKMFLYKKAYDFVVRCCEMDKENSVYNQLKEELDEIMGAATTSFK